MIKLIQPLCIILALMCHQNILEAQVGDVMPLEIGIDNLEEFPGIVLFAIKKNQALGETRKKIFNPGQKGVVLSSSHETLQIYTCKDALFQKTGLGELEFGIDRNVIMYPFLIKAGNTHYEDLGDGKVISRKLFYRIAGFKENALILEKSSEVLSFASGYDKVRLYRSGFKKESLSKDINDAIVTEKYPYIFLMYPDKKKHGIHLELCGDYLGEFRFDLIDNHGALRTQRRVNKVHSKWVGFIPTKSLEVGKYQIRLFRKNILEKREFQVFKNRIY